MAQNPKAPDILAYRLYPRNATVAGRWYHTLTCKKCSNLIYPLDDNSNGESPLKLIGDRTLRVPCPRCLHDDTYLFSDLRQLEAKESIPGFRPLRVPISKSSRVPLLPRFKDANPIMGVGLIEDRPHAAAIVGRIVTAWADIEVQCARLLARLMGTNIPAAAAVFGSLRSSRTQADALNAVAQTVLEEPDEILFSAHMTRKAALEKERNDLAHGCYGVAVSIPDGIVWVSQSDFIRFTTTHDHGTDEETLLNYRKRMFVYELGTLERIAQEIEEFHVQLGSLTGYLGSSNAAGRGERYTQLCNQPHIREALGNVQAARKSSRAPPRSPRGGKKRK